MKTLIYLLRKKTNKEGKSPLYLRFTENTIRAEVFTNIYVHPLEWDNDNKIITGNDTAARVNNNRLTHIQLEADRIIEEYAGKNEYLTVNQAKELKATTFLEILQLYIENQKENIGKPKIDGGITEETYKTYLYRQKRIKEFLASEKLTNIKPENADKALIAKFTTWSKAPERSFQHSHIVKHIKLFKTVSKYALENQLSLQNQLLAVKVKYQPKPKVFLTQVEIRKIMNHTFASKRLQEVADTFIVQCYTGFSYVDLMQFNTQEHVQTLDDGTLWIKYQRQKSEIRALLPLFSEVARLMKKYNGKLPHISNQKYNAYIKEVADIVGIDKCVTTHTARKSCGTITLNAGFSLESVSRMLGHASVKTTEKLYTEVLEERMIKESAKSTMFSSSLTTNYNQGTLFDQKKAV
ncbi:MAG: site-specific integrase [Bacteroidia bacterium]|nr:site-specific integrase [Bacteroidia bacterium]